jgi:hypothetical protein
MNIIWVANDGSDITGDGSYEYPYQTIDFAASVFITGDQIRLKSGTYNPSDSLVFSGIDGSIFSEDPRGAIIQPVQTTLSNAVIEVTGANRFDITGIVVNQALTNTSQNQIGILINATNILIHKCTVSDFIVPSGNYCAGIEVSGNGAVDGCIVEDFTTQVPTYGLKITGCDLLDCSVSNISGMDSVIPIDIHGGITSFSGFDDLDYLDLSSGRVVSDPATGFLPVGLLAALSMPDNDNRSGYYSVTVPDVLKISSVRTLNLLFADAGGVTGDLVLDCEISLYRDDGTLISIQNDVLLVPITNGSYTAYTHDVSSWIAGDSSLMILKFTRNTLIHPEDTASDVYYFGGAIS